MAADQNLRVDPELLQGFAEALRGGATGLRHQLSNLDDQVTGMLSGWHGASGGAYASAWELWHRGAAEVEMGLSMLARLITQAGRAYQDNEAASARALGEMRNG